jgi:formylglycine-generating enzyme required for sulfatase activity
VQLAYPNRPVAGVSWYEAMAYCRWRSRRDGQRITLPTEAQWERAARGTERRRFPWGSQIPDGTLRASFGESVGHTTDVGSHPDGDTPGTNPISDLGGNVLEWCLDRKVSYESVPRAGDGLRDGRSGQRVTRGGSFYHDRRSLRAASRSGQEPGVRTALLGFRLVRVVQPQ